MNMVLLVLSMLFFILLGLPICYALGAASIVYFLSNPGFLIMLPQRMWAGANISVMIALPLFIIAGELMNRGGMTRRIIDFSAELVRPFRGGLGEVNVVASMIFGGISGSSVSETSALGSVLIPEMVKRGYPLKFSAGLTVAAATMGMIIPPSIPMIMYSMVSGESVGALFLAGLLPGVLIGLTQLVLCNVISRRNNYPLSLGRVSLGVVSRTFRDGILAILMPVAIIVSVGFGIATATESAGIAVFYALCVGGLFYKELRLAHLKEVLTKTVIASSSVMIIVAYSLIFTWILAFEHVPDVLGAYLVDLNLSRTMLLLLLDAFILFVGCIIDVGPAILLLCPILVPVVNQFGISTLHFGAILIVGLAIGLVTPPVGMCLYAGSKLSGLPITTLFLGSWPFLTCNLIIFFIVTFVPEVSTWVPGLFMGTR